LSLSAKGICGFQQGLGACFQKMQVFEHLQKGK
jgi:hypothetical protein